MNQELTPPTDETPSPPPTHETPQEIITIKKPQNLIDLDFIFLKDEKEGGVWRPRDEKFVKVKNEAKDPTFKLEFWKRPHKNYGIKIENIEGYSTRVLAPETNQDEEALQYSFDKDNQRLRASLSEDKRNIMPDELSDYHRSTQLIEVISQENRKKSYFLFISNHYLEPAKNLDQKDKHTFRYAVTPVEIQ